LVSGTSGKIFIVKVNEYTHCVEGEAVARQADRDREWAQIYANLGVRDRLGRRDWRLAKHIPSFSFLAGARHETHPSATGTVVLPADRSSDHSRLFESIGGSLLNSLIFWIGLTQLVDFHESFRYFSCLVESSLAKTVRAAPVCELFSTSFCDSLSTCK
jgi:hypothetical protein